MFKHKVVIITGGSSGIGAATALLFAKEGASVAIVGRNEERLKNVSRQCEQHGARTLIVKADISKDEEAKTIVEKTIDKFGKLDILVNNAGIIKQTGSIEENVLEVIDELFKTNLRAVIHMTMLAAPHLVKSKGNIVNVSSSTSMFISENVPGIVPYAVTKAGLDHYARGVALELAASGVRVNCVNAGPVATKMLSDGIPKETQIDVTSKITALNRVSQPEEVANMIMYLASEKATSITGSCIVIDNGYLLK